MIIPIKVFSASFYFRKMDPRQGLSTKPVVSEFSESRPTRSKARHFISSDLNDVHDLCLKS